MVSFLYFSRYTKFFNGIPAAGGFLLLLLSCQNTDPTNSDLAILSADGSVSFNIHETLDESKTANCGTATPYSSSSTSTSTTTTSSSTSSTSTTTTQFTIVSRLFYTTGDYVYLKFLYDSSQNQGQIDSQQGFAYSGSLTAKPMVANYGKITWGGSGVPIDTTISGTQALSYLTVSLDLIGNEVSSGSAGLALTQCYTTDEVNCTSATSTSMCYTENGTTCFNTQSVSGTMVSIKGDVNCTSNTVTTGSTSTTSSSSSQ
ncbi:LIC10920 family plasminogen-binding lipoprotein [Leptospira fletcheri]|uniref:LIC10920 family plasminogen-binding lipoprotein n=1 Tax=Leptospira fletcheri TaxID=2484981 RepID=UPI001FEB1378|nr:hypothetical protein [Leptospira fletcheri]